MLLWEHPWLSVPTEWGVKRVVVYSGTLGGPVCEQHRGNPVTLIRIADNCMWANQVTVQFLWDGGAALGDLTFDPRQPYGGPPTIVYIGTGKPWPDYLPRDRYTPTAEQGPGATKYRLIG